MIKRYRVRPYKQGSKSAKLLANALGGMVLKLKNSKFVKQADDLVVNWGGTNKNKLEQYEVFSEFLVDSVFYTASKEEAQRALDGGTTVYARTKLNSMGGNGIVVVEPGEDLPDAKVYTAKFAVKNEYRVHVAYGGVIKVQQKRRVHKDRRAEFGIEKINYNVRNLAGGWIFAVNDIDPYPPNLETQAVNAVDALGYDFGAVDIAVDENGNVCVFEVNTAPGLCETTAEAYASAIKRRHPPA